MAPGGVAAAPAADWAPAAEVEKVRRVPFWKRWFQRTAVLREEEATSANKRRIALLQPDSFVAEQYRTLRTRLESLAAQRPIRTLAVVSALPGEGKTSAAINLAIVSEMHLDRRVLLVDCDLRKPKVHRTLGITPTAGLAEVLLGQASVDQAIYKVTGPSFEGGALEVLPVHAMPPNPSELLASAKMKALIEELARRYDVVILDTPAALSLPDAKTVTELTDGAVMVVRADTTPESDVQTALDLIDRRRVLGVVLNGSAVDQTYYSYR
ncbi:MAG: CpsD/CapB family tyrosine-protein kinase [Deltaproteobacteria bacterium]|nr:CpsD/CapB family tyrosine-protein kinase [Deltaproteobacteria bacterium]